jgi:hypothetical protein
VSDFLKAEGEKTDDNKIASEEAVATSFYSENVALTAAFMDENPGAQGEAFKSVAGFLCVCVRWATSRRRAVATQHPKS